MKWSDILGAALEILALFALVGYFVVLPLITPRVAMNALRHLVCSVLAIALALLAFALIGALTGACP